MSWNEAPPVGLYVVLALVMAWCAILTNELREVLTGEEHPRKQIKRAWRLRRFAGKVLNVARLGLFQLVIFLVAAAFQLMGKLTDEGGFGSLWELTHLTLHIIVIMGLYQLLNEWLARGQLNPRSRYL